MAAGIIGPGTPAPDFRLIDERGEAFTREQLLGRTTVLVFYPNAFSPVCTDQFQVYEEVLDEFEAQGATLYGVSCDSMWSQKAFKEKLGTSIEQLSDFEPKGEASRAFGAYFEPAGFSDRAIVIVDPEGVVQWSHVAENPGVMPGANLIFDGLAAGPARAQPVLLYTCDLGTSLGGLGPLSHPCGRAAKALGDAGHTYDREAVRGGSLKLWTLPRRAKDRAEVERLSGQRSVPILVLDDGEVVSGSHEIARWAREHPAAQPPAGVVPTVRRHDPHLMAR